jgi:hypothetical protein
MSPSFLEPGDEFTLALEGLPKGEELYFNFEVSWV